MNNCGVTLGYGAMGEAKPTTGLVAGTARLFRVTKDRFFLVKIVDK